MCPSVPDTRLHSWQATNQNGGKRKQQFCGVMLTEDEIADFIDGTNLLRRCIKQIMNVFNGNSIQLSDFSPHDLYCTHKHSLFVYYIYRACQ